MIRSDRPTTQAIILARPSTHKVQRVKPALWSMLAVSIIGGTAVFLLPQASLGMNTAKGIVALCALGSALYCLIVLADIRKGKVGLVWVDGGVLFCRTPHLDRLRLQQPVTARVIRRRSIYGSHDELIVRNADGQSLTVTAFYSETSAAAMRDALIGPEDAMIAPGRPWG